MKKRPVRMTAIANVRFEQTMYSQGKEIARANHMDFSTFVRRAVAKSVADHYAKRNAS